MVSLAPYRRCLSSTTTVLTALAAGLLAVAPPVHAAVPAKPAPAGKRAAPPADPVAAAISKARAEARQVPVPRLTDEYSTTTANPDGTLTTIHSSAPARAKQGDKWVPIDTTLVRRSDGSYAPRAATAGLTIAADRSTTLLSMRHGTRDISFTWPQALPAPVVSGDTATYPEVYPGVDLQITADPTGYSSVFVVKTRDAARAGALRTIDFGLTGHNVRIGETANGGAEAVDAVSGEQVFHTDTALMWDSTPSAPAAKAPAGAAQADEPGPQQPGRNMAEVPIDIDQGKQRLTLDQKLLTGTATTFPVYIDPVWSGSPSPSQLHWARISTNGWDYYNSTSRTGATSARIGLDQWPGGAGETARTYYHMNTSGIKGAQIFAASLYVVERHASSCSNTPAVVYATARPSAWNASSLNWGKQPAKKSGLLSTVNSRQIDCNTSKERVSPASLNFNVLSYIKAASASQMSNVTFLVQAADEGDKFHWKQLGYGGGATLSVTYSYKPQFLNGTGNPTLTPSVFDNGVRLTSNSTPTLSAQGFTPKVNGQQENVQITYQIFLAGLKVRTGYGPASGYTLNGAPWHVTPPLPDGNYTWKAAIKNASGVWGGVWSTTQAFTVDTKKPNPPQIKSTQFPAEQLGGSYTDRGVFELITDKTNNVNGYLFTLDGDLSTVTKAGDGTKWETSTVIQPGKVYLATADNGNGTGDVVINGSAGVTFPPGTAGAHKIVAKAVDRAGSTSAQTVYPFYAGSSTPIFATGDKLISGWTATNGDGSTTVVPPASTTSQTAMMVAQAAKPGRYYISDAQAFLANRSTTSKVANGDSATFYIDLPTSGLWEMGANLTTAADYGTYTLTLDKGTANQTALITGFDAYGTGVLTTFRNFGIVKDSSGTARQLTAGLHTLTLDVTGKNAASTGYQAAVDAFRLAPALSCAINDTARCLNNTGISTFTAGTNPTVTVADATGTGISLDAATLRAAGWTPAGTVTVNGAAIKLPAAYGTGATDNMLSSGQLITVPPTGVVNKGNAIVLTGFATGPIPAGRRGMITYGSGCDLTSESFTLDSIADWASTTPADAVLTFARRNKSNATQENVPVSLFAVTVPLACPGVPVTSITLPLVTNSVAGGVPALHILGLGIRPTSATGSSTTPVRWTGSWATAQDTATVKQTSGNTTVDATLNNQTIRIPAQLSIGTTAGHQLRVRLANSLGKTPVTFDAVSLAAQDTSTGGAAAAATPLPVTFNGARDLTLPAGTDILSDPVTLAAPDRTGLLVSIKVRGTLTALSGHQDGRTPVYVSAADNSDHTGDKAATAFTASAMLGTPFLSGIDVTTTATGPAGSVVLYGDQTVNADTATRNGHSQLDNRLAEALAGTPATGNTVPFGVLNLGSSKAKLPAITTSEPNTAPAALGRTVLNQSNVRAVLISAGTNDLLACTAAAQACADPVTDKLTALAVQLRRFTTDDAGDPTRIPRGDTGAFKIYVATLPPFTTAATTTQEQARRLVNDYILGTNGSNALQASIDNTVDFAAAVAADGDHNASTTREDYLTTGSSPNPNDDYFAELAEQYLNDVDGQDWATEDPTGGTDPGAEPVAVWKFSEGSGSTAHDTGKGTGADLTTHDAALHQVGWGQGRIARRFAGTFNGTSSYAETDLTTNTVQSFTISAWVRLTDKTSDRTVIARESGNGFASLYLRYQQSSDRWVAQMPSAAAGDTVVWREALSSAPARAGLWTHLAATYDATGQTLTLYIDGAADSAIDDVKAFNDPNGPTWIGRSDTSWFAGDIADVKVWHRTSNDAELATDAAATLVARWELDDDTTPTTAVDTSGEQNDGTLAGSAAYNEPGHFEWDEKALHLDGTNAAVTTPQLLRTDQSFTVAAWVKPSRTDGTYTVLSQDGANTSRFALQWNQQCSCWRFTSADTDQNPTTSTAAVASASTPVNTWTHLAATYDAVTGTMTLYVNGQAAGTATTTVTPWNATGSFAAGRARRNGGNAEWFPGDIDAVRTYQGALSADTIGVLGTL